MLEVTLRRTSTGDQGTVGRLEAPGFRCFTLELPWRENRRGLSCIPPGTYPLRWGYSASRRSWSWRFEDAAGRSVVPGRAGVLIHAGNYAGDVTKGLRAHVQGCVLLGRRLGTLDGQLAALLSRAAVQEFAEAMRRMPFALHIVEDFADAPGVA